jgi:hypothetical protein
MLHLLLALVLPNGILLASDSRCNGSQTGEIQAQLQQYANHPASKSDQQQRAADILSSQNDVQQERTILENVCPEIDFRPLDADLFALDAWTDLLTRANGPSPVANCPDKQKAVDAATAADAYVKLAQAATLAPQPAQLVAKLLPQIQTLAAQSGVTLPSFTDASSYWAQQYQDVGKQAVDACAGPNPSPSA